METINNIELNLSCKKLNYKVNPLFLYKKLYDDKEFSFYYESLENNNKYGRYSFFGGNPFLILKGDLNKTQIITENKIKISKQNIFKIIKDLLVKFRSIDYIPPFSGGAVGYVSYDSIRFFEKIPDKNKDNIKVPEALFIFPSEIIVFDHKQKSAWFVHLNNKMKRLQEIKNYYKKNTYVKNKFKEKDIFTLKENCFNNLFNKDEFIEKVIKAKQYIKAGEIFQVVISERAKIPFKNSSFELYKALRMTNPSPYMYYLNFGDINIIGSSPEILVKSNNRNAVIRPLAGTRKRGKTSKQDRELEKELLSDEKERAEHLMLLDLARNDLGRVCKFGSIKVNKKFEIEKYSKVMHIVSNVKGTLRNDKDIVDLFKASFPAGTVTGAPKIRAMEIIDELEISRRGIYAGSIGYFGFSNNMDMCISIRTIVAKNNISYVQAGAGIVADSSPEKEYNEIINKSRALISALKKAEEY